MLLEEFTGTENHKFSLHRIDKRELEEFKLFLTRCGEEGGVNNSSLKHLKFGKWGEHEAWWAVKSLDTGRFVSMSAAHALPHISPKCYMLAYRVYTLKAWRGTSYETKDHRMLNEFHHGWIQPHAVDWCKSVGADTIVTTVNTAKNTVPDPNGLDYKFARVARIMFPREGKYDLLHEDFPLYNRYQDVWKLNYRDFKTMEPL